MKDILRLLSYLKPYWHFQLLFIFCALGNSGCSLIWPWLRKILIDDVFIAKNAELLLPTCGFYALTAVGMYFFKFGAAYFPAKVSENGSKDLQLQAYHHLRKLGFKFYDTHQTGKVMATFTSDTPKAVPGFNLFAGDYIINGIMLVVTLGIITFINWQLCVLSLLLVAVNIIIPAVLDKPLNRMSEEIQEQNARLSSKLQESIAGSRELKGLGKELYDLKSLRKFIERLIAIGIRHGLIRQAGGGFTIILFWLAQGLIFFIGGGYVLRDVLTIGELLVIIHYFGNVHAPVSQLVKLHLGIPSIMVATRRIFAFFDEHKEESQEGTPIEHVEGRVQFSNVSFEYNEADPILQEMNFQVEPDETVAIVGASGAGKSTLVSLIPRFYEPQHGNIRIDTTPINTIQIQSLRSHIGIVFQDPYLFAESIAYNICLGAEDPEAVTHEEIVAAAKLANAHDFIMNFPEQYETKVGERGVRLSGGEQQRIAIARVLIRDPKILILDEATSSLDAESEALVQDALTRLMKGRTSFVIAHRLSTILDADKILVLKDGRLIETGTHAELIQRGGVYHTLFQKQFAGMQAGNSVIDSTEIT